MRTTLYIISDEKPGEMLDFILGNGAEVKYEQVAPGNVRVIVPLTPWDVQEIEDFFGEDATLHVSLDDGMVWHAATLGAHDIRWWAGYR